MIHIFLSGCNGAMGKVFTKAASNHADVKIVGGLDIQTETEHPYPVFVRAEEVVADSGARITDRIDAVVDFSHPSALSGVLKLAVQKKTPVMLATTGYSDAQKEEIRQVSQIIPVFQTANLSVGVNLLAALVKQAVVAIGDGFDIEIVEKHHNRKVDAPSGTALLLANAANDAHGNDLEYVYDRHARAEKRGKKEIGIQALRGGNIVGEHTVLFAGNDEVIELKHTAYSREIFAEGAIRAVRFLLSTQKTSGIYSMQDIFNG